jgi:hypothetical protein
VAVTHDACRGMAWAGQTPKVPVGQNRRDADGSGSAILAAHRAGPISHRTGQRGGASRGRGGPQLATGRRGLSSAWIVPWGPGCGTRLECKTEFASGYTARRRFVPLATRLWAGSPDPDGRPRSGRGRLTGRGSAGSTDCCALLVQTAVRYLAVENPRARIATRYSACMQPGRPHRRAVAYSSFTVASVGCGCATGWCRAVLPGTIVPSLLTAREALRPPRIPESPAPRSRSSKIRWLPPANTWSLPNGSGSGAGQGPVGQGGPVPGPKVRWTFVS